MTSLVDETLLTHGGRERSVAATKTFTGQMLLFYMLAAELARNAAPFSYESIPEGQPVSIEALAAVGDAYSYMNEPAKAEVAFKRAVERFPDPRLLGVLPADCAPQIPLLGTDG